MVLAGLGAIAIGQLHVRGTAETLLMAAIGVITIALAWLQTDTPRHAVVAPIRLTAWCWAIVALSLCLTQLFVYLLADPPLREFDYPTLTYLVQPVINEQPVVRGALLAGWLLLGFALLRWSSVRNPEQTQLVG
jgi:hypothetical protein